MELQHLNVKLFIQNPEEANLENLIPVFHGWIQGQVCEELLLDVADYRHVHEGPGVVLIGHEGNYSLDNTGGRLGVRYNRKAVLNGSNQDRLAQAVRPALTATRRLETDPRLEKKFCFNGREMEIFINDRLIAPNLASTREAVCSELNGFLGRVFGGGDYSLSYEDDPRRLFRVSVRAADVHSTEALLNCLTRVPV